ncbi:MAG: branched-chain amino acid aminotransferase [Polyangiaceae bacterium]|nr:branched-chain amino acid aminotransferase [Polyangiaceae bacterium]
MSDLGFGKVFSEHMVTMRYEGGAWRRAELVPYGPLSLDPASTALHYGQAIFEGFKAYSQPDGGIATFRPEANARRFQASARRLAMAEVPVDRFLASADALIRQDRGWVPREHGQSLYLRPLLIGVDPWLGVKPSSSYLFVLLASPSGAYFAKGMRPVSVWISDDYVRASPGGTGAAKCAGNYAASLVAQAQAAQKGCDQVVWLDAVHRRFVEELGGMNIFFVLSNAGRATLVTPELTGTLLPGVTRDSLLVLGREQGLEVEERLFSVEELGEGLANGRITEVFACGTAAVITPVGSIQSRRGAWAVGGGEPGPVASRLRDALLAIQHGTAPDPHGWMHRVC